tara:strand:+ start:2092 stop:2355 length:264 start_codon:yes stop_codon:yes gene_type:complete
MRKPMKVEVGDSVTSTQLKKHGLARDSPMFKGNRKWKIVEMKTTPVTISGHSGKRKRKPHQRKITRLVLEAGRGKKVQTFRTFWFSD